jgi:hypothetical protein
MPVVSHSPDRQVSVVAPSVDDVIDLFVKRGPRRRKLIVHGGLVTGRIGVLIKEIAALLEEETGVPQPADIEVGEGLSAPLARGDGARRLATYATPFRIEDWAGEVAGSTELVGRYGISRSTLHDWQKRGAVVGLLAGSRKHVFPVAQFIDGRPVEGLAGVVAAAGSPRTAWLWLVEPHPSFGGRKPLARLEAGDTDAVIDLAKRDFGQS